MTKAARTDDQNTGKHQRDGKRGRAVDAFPQEEERQDRRQERGDGQHQKRVCGRRVLHGRTPTEYAARVQPDDQQPFPVKPFPLCRHGLRGKDAIAQKKHTPRKQPPPEGQRQHIAANQSHDQRVRDEDHHTCKRHQNAESLRISLCKGCHAVPKSFRKKL